MSACDSGSSDELKQVQVRQFFALRNVQKRD